MYAEPTIFVSLFMHRDKSCRRWLAIQEDHQKSNSTMNVVADTLSSCIGTAY
jgi:hypothetical protein